MAELTAVEKELREATGLKPKKGQDRGDFLELLVKKVGSLPDEDWESLSTEAQLWYNDAAKAVKADEDIQDFDSEEESEGEDEPEEETDVDDANVEDPKSEDEEEEEEKPAKRGRKASGEKKEKKEKKAKKGSSRPAGAQRMIKRAILKKPSITVDELIEKTQKAGFSPTRITISTIRASVRDTLKVMKEEGMIDIDL